MGRGWAKYFCCLCLIAALSAGCGGASTSDGQAEEPVGETEAELPDDFIAFYQKFHSDSAFQWAHVIFPLTSVTQDSSGLDSTITWTRENWVPHMMIVPGEEWSVDFQMPLNNIVVEHIYARNGSFSIERRFARSKSDWYLIYYSGLVVDW